MHEVIKWAGAVPMLVGFGLALGLNPALYGTTADTLARNTNVGARLTWLLAGLVSGATLLVLVLHGFDPTSLMSGLRSTVTEAVLSRTVDLAAGALFVIAAAAVVVWKRRVPVLPPHKKRDTKSNAQSISYFAIGASSAIVGFTTLPIMYLTGRLVVSLSPHPPFWVLAYMIFLAALVAPFVGLALIWSRFPATARKVTGAYTRVLESDYRPLTAVLLALAGLVLLGLGLFLHR